MRYNHSRKQVKTVEEMLEELELDPNVQVKEKKLNEVPLRLLKRITIKKIRETNRY